MMTCKMLLSLASLALAAFAPCRAQVVTYAAPDGAELNDDFTVSVMQDGKAYASPTYAVKVAKVVNARKTVEQSSATQFSFGGMVEVAVTYLKGDIDSVRVRPLSLGIRPHVEGRTIRFPLDRPQNLSVEVNGDIYHNLQLFANAMETNVPKRKAKNVIWFGPGLHHIKGDTLRVSSNTTVYVAGGAVVKGHLWLDNVHDVRVCGRGFLDTDSYSPLQVRNSRNVEVEGLVMSQCPVGGSSRVHINNVKVISSFAWGDGLNVFASDSVTYDHCFARTSDDCHTVYATRKGFVGGAKAITMRDCVLWADVAHPITIGLHGRATYQKEERGMSVAQINDPSTSFEKDTIEDLRYENLDILEQREMQTDYQGCLSIACSDLNVVRRVVFDGIRVEEIQCGQLFNVRTTWNTKYCAAPGQLVEDITFRNVSYKGKQPTISILEGYSPDHPVCNICFERLSINGQTISDTMPGKPKWYKTSDFANMYLGANVSGVTFTE